MLRVQIMDANRAPLLLDDYGGTLPEGATLEMKRRGINPRRYKVVPVVVQEIEKRRQQTEPERKPLPAGYYNLDCMAALPLFPDKFFDIAVIDAPYGIGADNMAMGTNKVLFGKLSAPTFFTLNAPVFQMVWINIQNFCICLRSLFKVSIV